jgi:REP element-mobilizing transposase RayT
VTAPRQILAGTTYLITRRCAQRQMLLRPSEVTNSIVLYVLAVAAQRYGVQVHAYCVMSNHLHAVVTDPGARLPAFQQYLDSLVARAMNASLGRWESFWAPSSYSAVELASPDDILEKTVYVLANPVAAGLVSRGGEWPGLWSDPASMGGGPLLAPRPTVFFSPRGTMPRSASLELVAPPGFESADDFRARAEAGLAEAEARHAEALRAKGRSFLGPARVLALKPSSRPHDFEPRRGLDPHVAARRKWLRVELLSRLAEFRRSYRAAWCQRHEGRLDAVFPAGTYLLRVAHHVRCAAA